MTVATNLAREQRDPERLERATLELGAPLDIHGGQQLVDG